MQTLIARLAQCHRAATAVEYGLIAALIVVVLVGGVSALGGGVGDLWGTWTGKFIGATA